MWESFETGMRRIWVGMRGCGGNVGNLGGNWECGESRCECDEWKWKCWKSGCN